MKMNTRLSMLAGVMCTVGLPAVAMAQPDLKGRQYVSISAFDWDSSAKRLRVNAEQTSDTAVEGFVDYTQGSASDLCLRLIAGFNMTDWLGLELHVAGGGSNEIELDRMSAEFTVTFPDDFDFSQFENLTPEQIANLDPSDFEDVEIDLVEDNSPLPAKFKLNQAWGLFLRPNVTLAERINLFALAGLGYAKVDVQSDASWYSRDSTSLAFGGGIAVSLIKDRLSLTADYVQYADEDSIELDAMSLGVMFRY